MHKQGVYRIGIGVVAIAMIFGIVLGDVALASNYPTDWPLANLIRYGSLIPLTFLALCLTAACELTVLLRQMDYRPHHRLACAAIALFVLQPWLSASGMLNAFLPNPAGAGSLVLFSILVPVLFLAQVLRRDVQGSVRDTGATLLTIIYLGVLPSFGLHLRCGVPSAGHHGAWLLLIVILVTKSSDIGGYLVGTAIGRHRLIPSISPSKTYEGTVGGMILSALVAGLLVAAGRQGGQTFTGAEAYDEPVTNFFIRISAEFSTLGYTKAIIFGLFTAILSFFGDLFESCIKRRAGVKDSACRIPTYGGILDLLDSPCATLPVAWLLLTQVWRLGDAPVRP